MLRKIKHLANTDMHISSHEKESVMVKAVIPFVFAHRDTEPRHICATGEKVKQTDWEKRDSDYNKLVYWSALLSCAMQRLSN